MVYTCTDIISALLVFNHSDVHKHGILEVNSEGLVTALVEKPKANQTSSRKAVSEHSVVNWVPLAVMVHLQGAKNCI